MKSYILKLLIPAILSLWLCNVYALNNCATLFAQLEYNESVISKALNFKELRQLAQEERVILSLEQLIEINHGPPIPLLDKPPKTKAQWIKFFDVTMMRDYDDRSQPLFTVYRDIIAKISNEIRTALLEQVARRLPTAPKGTEENEKNPLTNYRSYPRRTLDAWIKVLLPPQAIFDIRYRETGDALGGFQAYLDIVNLYVISKMKKEDQDRGYGMLQANHLLAIAKVIQQFVSTPKYLQNYHDYDSRENLGNPEIYLYGSFFKGIGKNGSDIDGRWNLENTSGELLWSGYMGATEYGYKAPEKTMIGLEELLQKKMKEILPSDFAIEWHQPQTLKTFDFILDQLRTSFMIQITKDGIYLLVYPMPHITKNGALDPVAPKPARYKIG